MTGFPRRFGSYILLRPLARGGMGALYLALSGKRDTAKLCVIKTVLPHLADKEYLQRFRDEAKVVVRLSHGNLVPVFDSGQVEGEIYLAMDFVEGKDLRNTWNRCAKKGIAFPIDVAAHIVKELSRGLHYAHTFGDIKLVHRDVSPPNVLLSYSGEVRLTDFGLASSTLKLEKTAPGIIYGKVSYMSPEQGRGEPLDGRTDLYAAGIILWELLTGRQVFPSGKNGVGGEEVAADELLNRVRNPAVAPPSKRASRVPAELDRIAMKALAPDLANRYATCEELRQDLAAFLAQTSPATDAVRVSNFLRDLYDDDIESERTEREQLMKEALETFGQAATPSPPPRPVSSVPPPPPPLPGKPPPLRLPAKVASPSLSPSPSLSLSAASAPTAPATPTRDDVEARRERGTIVAGPARHDQRLNRSTHDQPTTDSSASMESMSSELLQSAPASAATLAKSSSVVGSVVGGRYQVRRLSGEGGMGRVYEAEHIDIGKRVALKILHPAYSQTPDLVERLRREARAASKISHPNVVDVTDSGTTDDGAFFFVMEYIEGIELGELIFREKRLDVARTLVISAQVCRALKAAHDANVIHRDLKPENVLILPRDGQRDFVKVLDFGIAKSPEVDGKDSQGQPSRRLTHPGMTMGTPEYMAPEQAAGRPADPRSDIYAVGGIMYEMLTGNPPYDGSNFMEILHKKANQAPAPLSTVRDDVPPAVELLIMRALAKDPADRPQSMDELEQEIQRILSLIYPTMSRTEREIAPLRTPRPLGLDAPPVAPLGLGALMARMATWDRKKIAIAGGGALGLILAFFIVAVAGGRKAAAPELSTPPSIAAPVAPPVVPPPPAPEPAAVTAPKEEPATSDKDKDKEEPDAPASTTARANPSRLAGRVGAPVVDTRKLLDEGERLLRAERFVEAREIFTRLTKSRRDRAAALVGLAEISFQEKHYTDAVRSAKLAADRGGGVRARVLLGDAHFRLNQYKEAAKAYEDALKLDPGNASAKGGLALANKRM